MVTLDVPTAVTVPLSGSRAAAHPGGGMPGVSAEEPDDAGEVVEVVAAPALMDMEATPPATALTPMRPATASARAPLRRLPGDGGESSGSGARVGVIGCSFRAAPL